MKKLISVCLSLVLLLACIPLQVSADGTPTFAVGTAEARGGETVDIPVLIENNPGIIALAVSISFNTDILTLQNAEDASLFSEGVVTFGGSYNTNTFNILWENGTGSNATETGTLAVLTFLIKEDAPVGETAISISYSASSVFDIDLTEVAFETRNGSVTVLPTEPGGWSFSDDCTLYTIEGSSGVNFVAGFDVFDVCITGNITTTGGWSYNVEPNAFGRESTGAKLVIYDETGTAVEEYYSVLFGDVNGDCYFDGTDVALINYAIGGVLEEPWGDHLQTDEYPQSFAADADPSHNLMLNAADLTCLFYEIGGIEEINQFI